MRIKWSGFILAVALMLNGCTTTANQKTDLVVSGMVEANSTSVSSMQSGRVQMVFVKEGDVVKKGDQLLQLEDTILKLQI
jgi:multidrug efflux pump subunit AcrA (membrane-fusion protein)